MVSDKQAALFLKPLQMQYPAAFKRNFVFYGMLKTKGLMDEIKEFIPWILAIMIFVSLSISLGHYFEIHFLRFTPFQAHGFAVLCFMLLFMLYVPIVLKQMKHSSSSCYEQQQHAPIKIAALIILQAINIAFIESTFLQIVLFFFAMGFGFVKFYKENLFRNSVTHVGLYYLQELRRFNFWSYKQTIKLKFILQFTRKDTEKYQQKLKQLQHFHALHLKSMHMEQQLCQTHKHQDLENYLDSLM